MRIEYYRNDFEEVVSGPSSGLRRIVNFELGDELIFNKLIQEYNFFEVYDTGIIKAQNRKRILRFKSTFSKDVNTSIYSQYSVPELDIVFLIGLKKIDLHFNKEESRIIGFPLSKTPHKSDIDYFASRVLELGSKRRHQILNPSDLVQVGASVLLMKKYISKKQFVLYELHTGLLNIEG